MVLISQHGLNGQNKEARPKFAKRYANKEKNVAKRRKSFQTTVQRRLNTFC